MGNLQQRNPHKSIGNLRFVHQYNQHVELNAKNAIGVYGETDDLSTFSKTWAIYKTLLERLSNSTKIRVEESLVFKHKQ